MPIGLSCLGRLPRWSLSSSGSLPSLPACPLFSPSASPSAGFVRSFLSPGAAHLLLTLLCLGHVPPPACSPFLHVFSASFRLSSGRGRLLPTMHSFALLPAHLLSLPRAAPPIPDASQRTSNCYRLPPSLHLSSRSLSDSAALSRVMGDLARCYRRLSTPVLAVLFS